MKAALDGRLNQTRASGLKRRSIQIKEEEIPSHDEVPINEAKGKNQDYHSMSIDEGKDDNCTNFTREER